MQNLVRFIHGANLQRNALFVQMRLYISTYGFIQKIKTKYYPNFTNWFENGKKIFYTMIKNYKK